MDFRRNPPGQPSFRRALNRDGSPIYFSLVSRRGRLLTRPYNRIRKTAIPSSIAYRIFHDLYSRENPSRRKISEIIVEFARAPNRLGTYVSVFECNNKIIYQFFLQNKNSLEKYSGTCLERVRQNVGARG